MELDFASEDIEKILLKKVLTDKNWLNIMSNLYDRRWFNTKNTAELINIILKYFNKYKSPPNMHVLGLLAKTYGMKHPDLWTESEINEQLANISNFQLNIPDDVVNANLKEFIRKNALSFTLLDNSDILAYAKGEKDSTKYQQTIDKCLADFDKVQKITFNDTDLGLDYFTERAQDQHWEFIRNPEAKIKTQWEAVDFYTNGGFLKDGRMLGLIMAQAGLGKSVFLSNLAVNFLRQGLSVVVISLEMSQDVYAQRFDAHISSKNINRLMENERAARERISAFYSAYPTASLVIKEFPPRSVNTNTIDSYLENLKTDGHKIDVIIVDYLNLVLPNRTTDSMFKDGLSVSEELRSLSYKYKAPVITAAQCNSEGMNSADIDMQNVSESRGIVHTVDFLAALFQTSDQRERGEIGFKILKNRLGGQVGKRATFEMNVETLVVSDVTFRQKTDDMPDEEQSAISNIYNDLNSQSDVSDI